MKTVNEKLEQWAIKRIETEFTGDVCLLLDHKSLKVPTDSEDKIGFGSYVPRTSRSSALARTFIIDGIGYDLYPQPWERLEKMAEADHYNLTCLDDSRIVWARSEEDRQRFESLQAKLRANLKNPALMLTRARNWINTATELFADTLFEVRTHIVRQNAGYICDMLANAVAYINGGYFRHGQSGQLDELRLMNKVPPDFIALYEKVIREEDTEKQKKHCHSILTAVKEHIKPVSGGGQKGIRNAAELASWYHELSYTWRRVYHFCRAGNAVSAYIWACMLQEEIGRVAADYNAPAFDIMGAFDADKLNVFAENAANAEKGMVAAIEAGAKLDIYSNVDEFLEKNP